MEEDGCTLVRLDAAIYDDLGGLEKSGLETYADERPSVDWLICESTV